MTSPKPFTILTNNCGCLIFVPWRQITFENSPAASVAGKTPCQRVFGMVMCTPSTLLSSSPPKGSSTGEALELEDCALAEATRQRHDIGFLARIQGLHFEPRSRYVSQISCYHHENCLHRTRTHKGYSIQQISRPLR